jgi:hypothetical protein
MTTARIHDIILQPVAFALFLSTTNKQRLHNLVTPPKKGHCHKSFDGKTAMHLLPWKTMSQLSLTILIIGPTSPKFRR